MSVDDSIFFWINGLAGQSAVIDWMMYQVSRPGNLYLPVILAVGYSLWMNWHKAIISVPSLGTLIGLSDLVGGHLKKFIERPRPCQVFTHINELVGCGGTFSMPSNHAMNTATAAAFLQIVYPRSGWVTWPLVTMIGVSRVYLGAHYVTDVFVGWIIGGALGLGLGSLLVVWPRFGRTLKAADK